MSESERPEDDEEYKDGRSPGSNEAIRAEFDWHSVTPGVAVIEAVAIAADREPTALEPLYATIDPDALNEIIHSDEPGADGGETTVSFVFSGYNVTVHSDGTIVVRPATE